MSSLPGLKIGLVWSGNPRKNQLNNYSIDKRRSIRLNELEPLFDIPGVTFVSLQKEDPDNQIVDYPNLIDYMYEIKDFNDTASLINALDLVISVDTSVVHLAGGLHKETWMPNRVDTCWRWMIGQTTSPWYPALKIYNQTTAMCWKDVVENIKHDILEKLNSQQGKN